MSRGVSMNGGFILLSVSGEGVGALEDLCPWVVCHC